MKKCIIPVGLIEKYKVEKANCNVQYAIKPEKITQAE